jgi:hypothetical protein
MEDKSENLQARLIDPKGAKNSHTNAGACRISPGACTLSAASESAQPGVTLHSRSLIVNPRLPLESPAAF